MKLTLFFNVVRVVEGFMKTAIWLMCCVALFAHGCDRKLGESKTAGQSGTTPVSTGSPNAATVNSGTSPASIPATNTSGLDACLLIKKSEIAAVQGAQVQSMVPNAERNGDLVVSQCYFMVNSADGSKNLSVHLQVTQADPKGSNPKAVKDYWERSFRTAGGKSERAENKKGTDGEPVAGIGEEAFWVGDDRMGVLYVLKKDKLIRVSIGGPDSKNRLEKSKTLMAKALGRLS